LLLSLEIIAAVCPKKRLLSSYHTDCIAATKPTDELDPFIAWSEILGLSVLILNMMVT